MQKFKKTLLTSILLAASTTTLAASPQGDLDATLSAAYGHNWFDANGDETDESIAELRASMAYTAGNGLGFQLDNVYARYTLGERDLASDDIAGHLYFRNDQMLFGILAQRRTFDATNFYEDDTGDTPLPIPIDQRFFGVEAQGYFGAVTLYGQAGFQRLNLMSNKGDGEFATLELRYFANDDWRIDATAGYQNVVDEDAWSASLGTEYRLTSTPLSVYATYDHIDQSNFTGLKTDRLMLGVKLNLGKDTLKQRDRQGVTLNPVIHEPSFLGDTEDDEDDEE